MQIYAYQLEKLDGNPLNDFEYYLEKNRALHFVNIFRTSAQDMEMWAKVLAWVIERI